MILSGKAGEQQLIKKEENVRNTRTNLSFTDFNLDTSNVLQVQKWVKLRFEDLLGVSSLTLYCTPYLLIFKLTDGLSMER